MAKAMIYDKEPAWRMVLADFLLEAGHMVVLATGDIDQAERSIMHESSLVVDIALVGDGAGKGTSTSYEAPYVAHILYERFPDVQVIGVSSEQPVMGVDHNVSKGEIASELSQAIAELHLPV